MMRRHGSPNALGDHINAQNCSAEADLRQGRGNAYISPGCFGKAIGLPERSLLLPGLAILASRRSYGQPTPAKCRTVERGKP